MGRPKGTKNIMRTAKDKEKLVLEYMNGKEGYRAFARNKDIYPSLFSQWIKTYREQGLEGLKSSTGKKKGGTKGIGARKPKSYEEELELKVMKLEIENARLKKGYLVKGGGDLKEYVTTFDKNMK